MRYAGSGVSKYEYSCYLVASLSHLILQQQDAVGLSLFDSKVRYMLPPSSNPSSLHEIVRQLENAEPNEKTSMSSTLGDLSERLRKKGLVVVVSDFFDEIDEIFTGLRKFRHRKHDVILFHVLDRDEVDFPLQKITSFEGLENIDLKVLVDPRSLRNAYLEELANFKKELKRNCSANRIDYVPIVTDQSLGVALSTYLSTRANAQRV
jgi:uncharacterized protein (DUF58 family)